MGSVGLGVGLGLFVASRTGYEVIYYIVPLFPIFRALLLSNYGQSILLRKMIETDYSDYEIKTDSADKEKLDIRNTGLFNRVYKAVYGFMDDRARTVDFVGLIILVDLYLDTNYTLYIFALMMVKWSIAYLGSMYVVVRGGWIESEHDGVIKSISQSKSLSSSEKAN